MGSTYILRLAPAFKPVRVAGVDRLGITPEELCDRFKTGPNRKEGHSFRVACDSDPIRGEPGKRTINDLNAIVKD
jgi:hypothetical protein